MRRAILFALFTAVFFSGKARVLAQSEARDIVVFTDPGFPASDSAAPSEPQLAALFAGGAVLVPVPGSSISGDAPWAASQLAVPAIGLT